MRPLCDTDRRVARPSAGLWGYLFIPSPCRAAMASIQCATGRSARFCPQLAMLRRNAGVRTRTGFSRPVPRVGTQRETGQSARV